MNSRYLIAALLFTIVNASPALADGTGGVEMDMSGTIVNPSCNINGGEDGIYVHMGNNAQGIIHERGAAGAPQVPLNIVFDDCPASTTHIQITFSGQAAPGNPTLLGLSDTSGGGNMAVGYGITIWDGRAGGLIDLGESTPLLSLNSVGPTTATYYLQYVTDGTPEAQRRPGNASGYMYFDVAYE